MENRTIFLDRFIELRRHLIPHLPCLHVFYFLEIHLPNGDNYYSISLPSRMRWRKNRRRRKQLNRIEMKYFSFRFTAVNSTRFLSQSGITHRFQHRIRKLSSLTFSMEIWEESFYSETTFFFQRLWWCRVSYESGSYHVMRLGKSLLFLFKVI
jgi:hypothetical protein